MEKTLVQLFEQSESQIREELKAITLPADSKKLTDFVSTFFTDKVQIEDYKKELTLSEIMMVNSAIRLISLPLSSITADYLIKDVILNRKTTGIDPPDNSTKQESAGLWRRVKRYTKPIDWPLVGASSFFGGLVGGIVSKTWGGVLCTAAGCVLGMYTLFGLNLLFSSEKENGKRASRSTTGSTSLDVDGFVSLLKQVCAGIDEIIINYRANIKQLTEQQASEKKSNTLADSYKPLLDRMAKMFVAMKNQDLSDEVKIEVDKLYRTLKNQHYDIVDYTDETRAFYIETPSPYVNSITLIKAAILENGELFEKGECLIPEK